MLLNEVTYQIFPLMKLNLFILDSGQKTLIIQVMSLTVSIKQLQQHKDLGVTFSNDLNWAAHHKVITVIAYQTLGCITRTFKTGCSTEAKKTIYCLSSFTTDILFPAVEASIN